MLRRLAALSLLILPLSVIAGAVTAGGAEAANPVAQLAPPQVTGVAVYVPFNVGIKVDGKLGDWAGVPVETVDYGPLRSPVYSEDGAFSFQVAADASNFYITMSAVDQTIIAGKHGSAFYNEDSMEFYFNTSSDLNAMVYGDHIWQINVNAADIGNKDPNKLTLTGTNSESIHVRGFVFKTTSPAGWGFEAAVPMSDLGIKPAKDLQIGFNAQLNGASVLDRNVQLVWSKADSNNFSYSNPSVFGTAIFFKVGQTESPGTGRVLPTPTPTPAPVKPQVSVNQVGYFPNGPKLASFATDSTEAQTWSLVDKSGQQVVTGQTTLFGLDPSSGDNVQSIDFSTYTTAGTGYTLHVGDAGSAPFDISNDVYAGLQKDALAYYYRSRSGIAIEAQYAGQQWARAAGHTTDDHVTCYTGKDTSGKVWPGCDYYLDVSGGWYDAGDYGKYVVNGGIAVWTLMDEYERNPGAFPDGSLSIPENHNSVPDILDEARWELKFMLGMQVPAGQAQAGMVHHKIHDDVWSNLPSMPPTTATNRYLFPPSTAATLNLAAVGAQCARIWKTIDPAFSTQCLTASQTAWTAAQANPNVLAPSFLAGGGDYGDANVTDEFYWAASELYVTTGADTYKSFLLDSPDWANSTAPDWGNTAALGTISLALLPNKLSADDLNACRKSVIAASDSGLKMIGQQGYAMPLDGFVWGSNSVALNEAMLMGVAFDLTSKRQYLDGAAETLDYVLGRNALNKSYVSGYGANPVQHPHHRFWANQPKQGYPAPPPGVVAGGANGAPADPVATAAGLGSVPLEKAYIDDIGSFSTNEVAINWNAPLAWVTALVAQEQPQQPAPVSTPKPAPASPAGGSSGGWPVYLLAVPIGLVVVCLVFLVWRRRRFGVRAQK